MPPDSARPGPLPGSVFERDSYTSTSLGEVLDRATHAAMARATLGLSPSALADAWADWAFHLATSPGKQLQLSDKALRKAVRFASHASHRMLSADAVAPCIEPLAQDRRFCGEAWQAPPFSLAYQGFLLTQQ